MTHAAGERYRECTTGDGSVTAGTPDKPGRRDARIILFGMPCAFTRPVLDALLAAPGIDLAAVVLPGAVDHATLARDTRVIGLERRAGLRDRAFHDTLRAIAPDVIVAACFPWRLPATVLAVPARGGLNVHPSLLPDGRGPEPVFWAFRWGLTQTGVTLHVMDAGLDTGPVIAQRRLAIPPDATMPGLEAALARAGAGLLVECLPSVLDGTAIASPQSGEPSRPAGFPAPDDLLVTTGWPVGEAARFIRAVTAVHGAVPLLVHATGQRLAVTEAVGVSDEALPGPVVIDYPLARVRFAAGTLTCRLVADSRPLLVQPRR